VLDSCPPEVTHEGFHSAAVHVGVIGSGPRGTILLDRLLANVDELAPGRDVHVHLVDPAEPGAGRVFRTGQSRELLMNTVCGDVTIFTDSSVRCEGPVLPGPSLYEWARAVAAGCTAGLDAWALAEAHRLEPWSYASRAFNGLYLRWALADVAGRAPEHVHVHAHRCRALHVQDDQDGLQSVLLDDGTTLAVDALVLATGHSPVKLSGAQQATAAFAASRGLVYVPPASPADVDLSGVQSKDTVLLRGAGLAFFDYVALLTTGRGGVFVRGPQGLQYACSGREPRMLASSRRGTPHLSRPQVRESVPAKHRPVFLTDNVVARLRDAAGRGTTDFMEQVWPLIAQEVEWVYYHHLLRDRAEELRCYAELASREPAGSPLVRDLVTRLVPDPDDRWDWEALDRPAAGLSFEDGAAFTQWVRERMVADVHASQLGVRGSAAKAAASALRDLRAPVSHVVSHGGLSGSSYRDHVSRWFTGLFNSIANGPPVLRVEQLVALVDSGVLSFTGPAAAVTADPQSGRFLCTSAAVGGAPRQATALIDAWVYENDVGRSSEPLLTGLVRDGLARPHVIPDQTVGGHVTGGVDVSVTQRVVRADGSVHPARFAYGPLVEAVEWLTATIARPQSNSTTLRQADSIARQVLAVAPARRPAHRTVTPVS
jgi:uncharacterized NAD(P)/FAD-binding protein YdhS